MAPRNVRFDDLGAPPTDRLAEYQQNILDQARLNIQTHPRDAAVLQPPPDAADNEEEGMDVDHDENMGFIGSLEPPAGDYAIELLLQQLGSFGRSYRREARASCTRIISEMYSPPRVTAELTRSKKRFRHVFPGFAFDLAVNDPEDGQPWDFSKKPKQEKARRIFR